MRDEQANHIGVLERVVDDRVDVAAVEVVDVSVFLLDEVATDREASKAGGKS